MLAPVLGVVLGHYGTTSYDALVFLHVVFVVVAFAPMVAMPLVRRAAGDDDTLRRMTGPLSLYTQTISGGALVLAGFVGMGIEALSDLPATGIKVHEIRDPWIFWGSILWSAMVVVVFGLVGPGERAIARGGPVGDWRVRVGGPLVTLMFLGTLALMIFKPGV